MHSDGGQWVAINSGSNTSVTLKMIDWYFDYFIRDIDLPYPSHQTPCLPHSNVYVATCNGLHNF